MLPAPTADDMAADLEAAYESTAPRLGIQEPRESIRLIARTALRRTVHAESALAAAQQREAELQKKVAFWRETAERGATISGAAIDEDQRQIAGLRKALNELVDGLEAFPPEMPRPQLNNARAALAASEPPDGEPTEPGWYWWREKSSFAWSMVDVSPWAGTLRVDWPTRAAQTVQEMGGEWRGPIQPPK